MKHTRNEVEGLSSSATAFGLTLATLLTILFISVLVAVPPTAVSLGMNQTFRNNYSAFVSQGWNFFTKDLQGSQFGAYAPDGAEPQSLLTTPQTRIENAWGLTRNQRAQGPELANVAAAVTEWQECAGMRISCAADLAGDPEVITNTSPIPTLCGRVVVTQEHQSPWSYRGFPSAHELVVDQIALVDVLCESPGDAS